MSDTRPSTPHGLFSWLGQLVLYGLFALAIGVFSQWPPYHPLGAEQALIKLSVSHVGKPIGECRKLSQAELDKLPPNMRFPEQCPRERSPLTMRVELDGKSVLDRVVPPTECNAIAQQQARKLAAKPLSALVETKRLMKKGQGPAVLERMGEEGASFGRMLREPAAREAFTAFMEKRKPDFSKV